MQSLKWLVVQHKERKARWPKTDNGDENLYLKMVNPREACVGKRGALKCVRIRLWPIRRDDSSRDLIGAAAGTWRSNWHRREVGTVIFQSACRLLALVREAIDSTHAGTSGNLQSAATSSCSRATFLLPFFYFILIGEWRVRLCRDKTSPGRQLRC